MSRFSFLISFTLLLSLSNAVEMNLTVPVVKQFAVPQPTQKMVAVNFILINVDSEKRLGNFSSFKLDKPVWFDVILPSMEVELVLMFNSSSKNEKEVPTFDIKGTFCLQNESKPLFSGLKGPVSKMISRKDLLSLKARTGCNSSIIGEKPRVYLKAIPTTKLTKSTGTLYAFLLHNQTTVIEPVVNLITTNTSSQLLNNTQVPTTPVQLIQNITVKRVKRQANQTSVLISNTTTTSNQSTQTINNSFHKWYNFSEHAEKLRLNLVENGNIRQDCNATISLQSNGCEKYNQTIIRGSLDFDLEVLFKKCNKSNEVQISFQPICLNPNSTIQLTLIGLLKEKQYWYQKPLFIKWLPIAVCIIFVIWVCGCYISLLRNRSVQITRHTFQRNTVLQRTNSDPAPKRTMSSSEVVAQTRWD